MLGVTLFALFLSATVGAAVVLADSFVRGREAFARLRREMAQAEQSVSRVHTVIVNVPENEPLPAWRPRPISRAGGRPQRQVSARMQAPLPAAA